MRQVESFPTISQYTEVICPKDSISIATFGQSNSANSMTEMSNVNIPENLYQYDWKSQKCYKYKEPLLGTTNPRGNAITHTAVKLSKTLKRPVVIIPFGVGGTSVLEWAYGDLSHQHSSVVERMKNSGLSPKIFLWHQGESDANPNGATKEIVINTPLFGKYFANHKKWALGLEEKPYYDAILLIAKRTLSEFPDSSFGIALASRCSNRDPWQPVRSAQLKLTQTLPNTFVSADSDTISGAKNRPDGCHFSSQGASLLSDLYYPSIMESLNKK